VKSIARTLLVCFLLLALPFQAFASASMLPPAGHAPVATQAAELPPCHQQMMVAVDGHRMAAPHAPAAHDDHASPHDKNKCGTCAACCVGAAMAPGLPAALALPPPSTASIPFRAGHLPSVDPVLPERPPSAFPA
jgi:hypothetical protein